MLVLRPAEGHCELSTLPYISTHHPRGLALIIYEPAQGIAVQAFEATEGYVTIFLEDVAGARTAEFEARVWFTDTIRFLIGFSDILDQAVLYLDMPRLTGYLDFTS